MRAKQQASSKGVARVWAQLAVLRGDDESKLGYVRWLYGIAGRIELRESSWKSAETVEGAFRLMLLNR
jgi:hypothetical protein